MEYKLYLMHWGIKGQRWGFRRFQNQDGSLTAAGKARYRNGESTARHQPSEARKKAKYEEDRKNILEKGKATDILRNKNKYNFTTEELNSAYKRISDRANVEANLNALSAKEISKGKATVDKILDTATVWRDRAEKGFNVWNTIAKLHNSFADEDDQWQQIGQPSVREKIIKSKLEKKKAEEKIAKEKAEKEEEYTKNKMAIEAKVYKNLGTSTDELLKYSKNLNKKDFEDVLTYMKSEKDKKEAANKQKKEESQRKKEMEKAKTQQKKEAAIERLVNASSKDVSDEELYKIAEDAGLSFEQFWAAKDEKRRKSK